MLLTLKNVNKKTVCQSAVNDCRWSGDIEMVVAFISLSFLWYFSGNSCLFPVWLNIPEQNKCCKRLKVHFRCNLIDNNPNLKVTFGSMISSEK